MTCIVFGARVLYMAMTGWQTWFAEYGERVTAMGLCRRRVPKIPAINSKKPLHLPGNQRFHSLKPVQVVEWGLARVPYSCRMVAIRPIVGP
jgi:hypothetical protein